jgi:hypothetical protein
LTSRRLRHRFACGSANAVAVAEQPAQLSSATVKLRSHGSGRGVHDRRDLLLTEPLDIGVIHHVAELMRQCHPTYLMLAAAVAAVAVVVPTNLCSIIMSGTTEVVSGFGMLSDVKKLEKMTDWSASTASTTTDKSVAAQ